MFLSLRIIWKTILTLFSITQTVVGMLRNELTIVSLLTKSPHLRNFQSFLDPSDVTIPCKILAVFDLHTMLPHSSFWLRTQFPPKTNNAEARPTLCRHQSSANARYVHSFLKTFHDLAPGDNFCDDWWRPVDDPGYPWWWPVDDPDGNIEDLLTALKTTDAYLLMTHNDDTDNSCGKLTTYNDTK